MTPIAISRLNQHGQLLIPSRIRKKYNISEKQEFKISEYKKGLYIEPVRETLEEKQKRIMKETTIYFKKNKSSKDFSFSTDGKPSNIAMEVDDILYR